jgi:hypothetical protein
MHYIAARLCQCTVALRHTLLQSLHGEGNRRSLRFQSLSLHWPVTHTIPCPDCIKQGMAYGPPYALLKAALDNQAAAQNAISSEGYSRAKQCRPWDRSSVVGNFNPLGSLLDSSW